MQSGEPSQAEQGAGLGDREEPLPPSAFPDILKQLLPLTPQTVPTHAPQRELEEDRKEGGGLPSLCWDPQGAPHNHFTYDPHPPE